MPVDGQNGPGLANDELWAMDEADREWPIYLVVTIPTSLDAVERGERFEVPLVEALGDLGDVVGAGSKIEEVSGELVITGGEFVVGVRNLTEALPIIRRSLINSGAPDGTRIVRNEPDVMEFSLRDR